MTDNIMYGQYDVPRAEDMVKFNVGQPSPSLLSLETLKKGMDYVSKLTDSRLLQYGNISGYEQFKLCLADFLARQYNTNVANQELFITNGITHAIMMICSLFLHSGSTVYVEEPTYFLAINIFRDFGLNIVSIPIENDGINLDKLEEELNKSDDTKTHMLYTIPTFHNPTSYTMSEQKRLKLASIINKYNNFMVIADEVYQMLYFDEKDKPCFSLCYYHNKIISLGTFSKILAPAYRLGWIQTKNQDFIKKIVESGQYQSSGGSSPFVQAIIHGIIMSGDLDKHIIKCREFLRTNCINLTNSIKEKMNDFVDFIIPTGGYFLWLKINDNIDMLKFMHLLEKYKIFVSNGSLFSAYKKCNNYIRLSFSYYHTEGIMIGVERLHNLFQYTKLLNNKLLIGVVGYKGKLGSKICNFIEQEQNMMVIENIDRNMILEHIDLYSAIIDVSRPDGTFDLITELNKKNKFIPLVIGTTGHLSHDLINTYALKAPVALVSNFSYGISEMMNILKYFHQDQWNISMVEKHHIHKVDAPSGTAKLLQDMIQTPIYIESIREGEIIGEHSIIFDREDESIIIEHKAKTRDLFAKGAINYIKWIVLQKCGLYRDMFYQDQIHNINKINKINKINNINNINFDIYSGCGNTFVMIQYNKITNKSSFAINCCSKTKTDGAIFVDLTRSEGVYWEYYNNDGNTVEMCGNGARCVVKYSLNNNYVFNSTNSFLINNYNIKNDIKFNKNDNEFSVLIHNFNPNKDIKYYNLILKNGNTIIKDLKDTQKVPLIHMGVPHLVFDIKCDNLPSPKELGETIKRKNFDVNTNLYTIKDNKIYVRTYERGVYDETEACGTGCCAVAIYHALITHQMNFDCELTYKMVVKSGNILQVKIIPNNQYETKNYLIYLSGPTEKLYSGEIDI